MQAACGSLTSNILRRQKFTSADVGMTDDSCGMQKTMSESRSSSALRHENNGTREGQMPADPNRIFLLLDDNSAKYDRQRS